MGQLFCIFVHTIKTKTHGKFLFENEGKLPIQLKLGGSHKLANGNRCGSECRKYANESSVCVFFGTSSKLKKHEPTNCQLTHWLIAKGRKRAPLRFAQVSAHFSGEYQEVCRGPLSGPLIWSIRQSIAQPSVANCLPLIRRHLRCSTPIATCSHRLNALVHRLATLSGLNRAWHLEKLTPLFAACAGPIWWQTWLPEWQIEMRKECIIYKNYQRSRLPLSSP